MTAIVALLLVGLAAAIQNAIVAAVAIIVLGGAWAYSPRKYAIEGRELAVTRPAGKVRIPLEHVREVRAATADDFAGAIRLWGNGGLFGYYGLFRTTKLGRSTWYVTNRANAVVLVTEARTVVLSPDDVPGFLERLRASTPVAGRETGASSPATMRSRSSAGKWGVWLGLGIGIATIGIVASAFLYSPGPPAYTLTSDRLAIHDRFYPVTLQRAGVDAEQVRVVDLATDTGWRPVARTNGFANPHYQSGWFRVANGRKVRLYSAGARRLVLIPAKADGSTVLLDAKAPDAFVRELRLAWAGRS